MQAESHLVADIEESTAQRDFHESSPIVSARCRREPEEYCGRFEPRRSRMPTARIRPQRGRESGSRASVASPHQGIHNFFSLILWVAAGLAFFAEWNDPGQDMTKVGYAIVTVILVSGLLSFWQEYRVEQTLAALRKLLPQQAQVLREIKVTRVPAEQLVPGDIVHLEQGDNIPADCRLLSVSFRSEV